MAHIKFNKAFSFWPTPRSRIDYEAGKTYEVRRDCADRAIKSEAGEEVAAPNKSEKDGKDTSTRKSSTKASDAAGSGNANDPASNGGAS